MNKRQLYISVLLLLLCSTAGMRAQDLSGATKAAPLQVVLVWQADPSPSVVGYNIYRKAVADASFPATPLNGGTPIAPITNCAQFQSIIPSGSSDWTMISKAFPDSATNTPLVDVCSVTLFPKGSRKWNILQGMAASRLSVARVMGQGYVDNAVVNGTQYRYRIRRVGPGNVEMASTGADEITITAGAPAPIPAPTGVRVVVGDAKLQILWNKPALPTPRLFNVLRATAPGGPYRRVNTVEASGDITRDLDSALVSPAANGFTDYEQWDTTGSPLPRSVPGIPGTFTGPANATTYYYKVQLKDMLGNPGTESAQVPGTPVDHTPPSTPRDVIVTALENESHFQIRFPKVLRDALGHKENPAFYRVYRYTNPEMPGVGATLLPGTVPHPVGSPGSPADSVLLLVKTDSAGDLRGKCGDKTYYYRVEAVDAAGNQSQRSAAVSGALKDTTKPENVKNVKAKGEETYIRVSWDLSTDCDIDRYLIYRAFCDYGAWLPCPDSINPRTGQPVYPPGYKPPGQTEKEGGKPGKPSDCGGPFALIGTVSHDDARAMTVPHFDDNTVPPGSPVCYAYLVKAQDKSQNISGSFPIPNPTETIVCERLRDKTPPPPAIISGMFSRDSAIRVEFIGAPVQDIAAYHLYRSPAENGVYTWVGGVTVVPPPATGSPLAAPYTGTPATCGEIPLASKPYMSAGTITDKVDPQKIYWYKVLGVDKTGNETSKDSAVGMSSFTFTTKRNTAPEIASITSVEGPCALAVTWNPVYDAAVAKGFIVFRSLAEDGPYYQLGNIVRGNAFNDNSVARNTTYWYRIAQLNQDGSTSNLSIPKSAVHP